MTRILLWVGAAGPIVFLGVATLLGFLDADYDATSQPISELAVGPNGWLMGANFFLCGLSIIALALGLYRSLGYPSRLGALLLSITGLGMFAQGMFPIDLPGARETESGAIHNLLSGPIILGLILPYASTANALRKEPGWYWHALCTALMPVVVLGLAFVLGCQVVMLVATAMAQVSAISAALLIKGKKPKGNSGEMHRTGSQTAPA